MADIHSLAERLKKRFASKLTFCDTAFNELTIEVAPEDLIAVCTALRDESDFRFTMLMDLCGVDYFSYGEQEWKTESSTNTGFSRGVDHWQNYNAYGEDSKRRYAAVYHLLSISNRHRLRLRTFAQNNDFPVIESVVNIWASANWFEREAFDLFGILFEGHPDLRRILTDYGFIGHPFRKDFPLSGHVEVRYDPDRKRVVYEPVSIEPRVLVPKVIRHDHRYQSSDGQNRNAQSTHAQSSNAKESASDA